MIATIFLVLLVTCVAMQDIVVMGTWKVNQAWIIENRCVNVSRPAMKCQGKCQLSKILETQRNEAPQDQAIPGIDQRPEFNWLSFGIDTFNIRAEFVHIQSHIADHLHMTVHDSRIFRPPRATAS